MATHFSAYQIDPTESDRQRNAGLVTVGLHLILFLLFWIIQVQNDPIEPEFADLTFSVLSAEEASALQKQSEASLPIPKGRPEGSGVEAPATPEVNLPQRRMLEFQEPEIPVESGQKLDASDLGYSSGLEGLPDERPRTVSGNAPLASDESERGIDVASGMNDSSRQMLPGGLPSGSQPFEFEWGNGPIRQVLYKKLPDYPPGVQKDVSIRLKFSIFPDGRPGGFLPLRKGDPILEETAIKALSTWRFSQLDRSLPQQNQDVKITLHFRLK